MTIESYSSLVSAVSEVAEDDSAEFLTYIPTAIDLAEVRLSRDIDSLGLVHTAIVTAQPSTATLTKPTGYKNGQDLSFVDPSTGQRVVMKKKHYSYILDYWPIPTSVGVPKYFADVDATTFILAPTCNASIAMTLRYEGRPTPLTTSAPTNWFTSNCPDALFSATMVEMSKFSRNYALKDLYEGAYAAAVQSLLNEARRARRDNSGNPQIGGDVNTLIEGGT